MFESGLTEMMEWIEFQKETLESMAPPDEDPSILQEQIEENKVGQYSSDTREHCVCVEKKPT